MSHWAFVLAHMAIQQGVAIGLTHNADEILKIVTQTQATRVRDTRDSLGLGETAFETAVEDLMKHRLVTRLQVGRYTYLFPHCEEAEVWGPQVVALRDWKLLELYHLVKELDLPLMSEVVASANASWGWNETTTGWQLGRLERVELVATVCLPSEPNRRRLLSEPIHPKAAGVLDKLDGSNI